MIILFDIGGTKTRLSTTKDGVNFSEPVICDTPDSFEEGMDFIVKEVNKIVDGEEIKFMCGGIAGVKNKEGTGIVENSSHTPDWEGKDIKGRLEKELNTNVYIENDAEIVGLGEAVYGAGKGMSIVGYITVSTGVGGGRIIDGKIDKNTIGFEPGHQFIDGTTTLENLVSGTAVENRFNKKPYEIPQEDPLWAELASHLARGVHNTAVHWSPEVIILGGSMIVGDPAIKISDVEKSLQEITLIKREIPVIKKAELGALGGIYGALVYAKGLLE